MKTQIVTIFLAVLLVVGCRQKVKTNKVEPDRYLDSLACCIADSFDFNRILPNVKYLKGNLDVSYSLGTVTSLDSMEEYPVTLTANYQKTYDDSVCLGLYRGKGLYRCRIWYIYRSVETIGSRKTGRIYIGGAYANEDSQSQSYWDKSARGKYDKAVKWLRSIPQKLQEEEAAKAKADSIKAAVKQ